MKYEYHVVAAHYDKRLKAMITMSHFATRTSKLDKKEELAELRESFEQHYMEKDKDIVPGSTTIVSWILVARRYEWFDILGPLCGLGLGSLLYRVIVPIIH